MCTSTELCRCHEHVRHMRSPNSAYAHRRMSSADIASKSSSGSWCAGRLAKQDLLEGVAAQTAAQGLERDHLVGRDVAEVDGRAELLDEPDLRGLGRRLEDDVVQRRPRLRSRRRASVRISPAPVKMPALPPSRASVITFHAPASSSSRSQRVHSSASYSTAESFEPTSESTVKSRAKSAIELELALPRDLDRPVRDLDVREPELGEPRACTRRACPARRRPRRTCRRSRRACRAARRACAAGWASRRPFPSRA